MTAEALGFLLWLVMWIFYRGLRTVLGYSIAMEEERITQSLNGHDIQILTVLRSVDVVVRSVCWAVVPFICLTIGSMVPTRIREFLSAYVGPSALIQAALAALFVYWALFAIWKKQVDFDARSLFRPSKPDSGQVPQAESK